VVAGLVIASCGDDDQLTGDRLAEELAKADIPTDVAACVADELPDGLSKSAVERQDDAEAQKLLEALGVCSEKLAPTPDEPITSAPTTTVDSD
jgi:hypothetical protein